MFAFLQRIKQRGVRGFLSADQGLTRKWCKIRVKNENNKFSKSNVCKKKQEQSKNDLGIWEPKQIRRPTPEVKNNQKFFFERSYKRGGISQFDH